MGLVKAEWMDAQERGWGTVDKQVCAACVEDPTLKRAIRLQARSGSCDYCSRKGKVAPVETLQEAVYAAVGAYFHEPADAGVPWDRGYIVNPMDIDDVFSHLDFVGHPELIEDIVDADMGNGWVPAVNGDWSASHEHEILMYSWSAFADLIKHKTRFHFAITDASSVGGHDEVEPGQMLEVLGDLLRPYIRKIDAGTSVFRARIRAPNETWIPSASELGAPPANIARAGRMNPVGIPYLYTAFDQATALQETGVTKQTNGDVFIATYKIVRPLSVIDLTRLPTLPSVFDVSQKNKREKALFIHGFVDAISKPVKKNGQEHVEYVPSQVVCEYLAQVFRNKDSSKLGGLVFPSSVLRGGKNLVVFPSERGLGNSFDGIEFVRAVKKK